VSPATADVERLLLDSTLADLAEKLRRGDVSPFELAEASLARLERLGPRYNALASLLAERGLREARRAADELRAGRDRGPLHGIPYAAKDLLAARGAPTTWGAEPFRDQTFDADATVVRRLGQAGAVLVGKLAMVALAGGGNYRYPSASLQGPGKNPWNPERWTGGSSSGSAAAVAARLVPYAIGSETSGSIVSPAAYCGLTGLRPTYGLVSRAGAMALAWTLDKLGPMAHTAEDCGLVLRAMAGVDAADPTTVRRRWDDRSGLDVRTLRVGYAPQDFEEHAAEPLRPAFKEALDTLRSLGVQLVPAELDPVLPYNPIVWTVIAVEGATAFADLLEDGRIDQLHDERQRAGLRAGLDVTARDYLDAMRLRTLVVAAFRDLFQQVDVVLAPARGGLTPKLDEPLDAARFAAPVPNPGNTQLTAAGNAAGLPAVAFPCGFTADGLPVGLQVVGRPFAESTLIRLVSAYQSATDWHQRRPADVD
jgi:aspartyl-tRNA(Asn)/glutamyl-tRNA(Gln) amidotransferase subunit A